MRRYASLTGPLLGYYYPMPRDFEELPDPEKTFRSALNSSRLKSLWCAVYTDTEVDEAIVQYGGARLEPQAPLDYDVSKLET